MDIGKIQCGQEKKHTSTSLVCTDSMYGWNMLILVTGTGALAAAKELAKRVNFSAISLSKTRYILGKAVDLSEKQDFESDETRLEYDILLSQATVFRDLEDLVLALCSFEPWMEMVNDQPPYVLISSSYLRDIVLIVDFAVIAPRFLKTRPTKLRLHNGDKNYV